MKVAVLRQYDVLFGRGRGIFCHTGNRRMLKMAQNFKPEYNVANKVQKKKIIEQLIALVRVHVFDDQEGSSYGPRFLKMSADKTHYVDVSLPQIYEKVAHILRDKKTTVLKEEAKAATYVIATAREAMRRGGKARRQGAAIAAKKPPPQKKMIPLSTTSDVHRRMMMTSQSRREASILASSSSTRLTFGHGQPKTGGETSVAAEGADSLLSPALALLALRQPHTTLPDSGDVTKPGVVLKNPAAEAYKPSPTF